MHFPRVRDLRNDAEKTQADIAALLHMQITVYRRYENGEREIPVWVVIELSKYYKTTTDYILGLTQKRGK